jgi:lipoprotein-anchoring transpeptidase ErfK/SrfK
MVIAGSTALLAHTAEVRYERDVTRMVFNDNIGVLEDIRKSLGLEQDSIQHQLASSPEAPAANQPYIVVSIEDHKLWYKQGDSVLYTTDVATGSGKVLEEQDGGAHWKFETPRGRLIVQSKELDPAWIPPDWHFVEQARKRGLGLIRLNRGDEIPAPGGAVIAVSGSNVVRRYPDGRETPIETGEDREIVIGGNMIVPPYGTNQRKYKGVLGTHRLNLGDGYALHGTDKPETIGRSVSHGCVRLRNEDIAKLYEMVPVGTTVYIY